MSPLDLNPWDGCVYFVLTDTDTETQVIQILISFETGKNIIGAPIIHFNTNFYGFIKLFICPILQYSNTGLLLPVKLSL